MQTPNGAPPNMVAVGNMYVPGTISQTASNQTVVPMQKFWRVRDGRGPNYTLYNTSQRKLSIATVHYISYLEYQTYLIHRTCRMNLSKSLEIAKEKL